MSPRIADTHQCPYCRAWIEMPLRRQREAFDAHKLQCRAEVPGAVAIPCSRCGAENRIVNACRCDPNNLPTTPAPFSPDCGRCGANIAADPFHHCASLCECGRGPILQGNGTPDCCATCYLAAAAAEAYPDDYPTFCRHCGEPRNSAELSTGATYTGWCHECRATLATIATVKHADLWGNVMDTHQTEAELNGFRASQGALL